MWFCVIQNSRNTTSVYVDAVSNVSKAHKHDPEPAAIGKPHKSYFPLKSERVTSKGQGLRQDIMSKMLS